MAQLTDDCFAFSGPLLPLAQMERLIVERVTPVAETERVLLRGARGRVTAADVKAQVDLPPFDNSAVDGYAVRHADLASGRHTRLDDRRPAHRRRAPGRRARSRAKAIRIFTGAAMPEGADTVFMQEDVTVEGDHVIVPTGLKRGANRRLAGEDVARGQVGCPPARCWRRSTSRLPRRSASPKSRCGGGSRSRSFPPATKWLSPARRASRAAIYDANRYLLAGLLARLGAEVTDLGILADDPSMLANALAPRPQATIWWSPPAASRPAKPITCAAPSSASAAWCSGASPSSRAGRSPWASSAAPPMRDSAAFVGLPGNPVAVFVTFVRVVKPLLRRLAGARPQSLMRAAGARGLRLPEEKRPPRICARRAAARRRRRIGGGQASAGRRRHPDVADRNRRPAGISRGRDGDRAGRPRRLLFSTPRCYRS